MNAREEITAFVGIASQAPSKSSSLPEMPALIADATLIARSPAVLAAEVDGEVVMMSIEKGCYFGLDDIASDIWKRIEPACTFAALVDALAADYDADRETIARDVRALLEGMAAQDVVRLA